MTPSLNGMVSAFLFTKRVGEVLRPLIGSNPSAATVSEVVKSLDSEVRGFHHRKIADEYKYLFLDGLTVRLKKALGVQKRQLLVAYGIRENGCAAGTYHNRWSPRAACGL